MQVVIDFIIQNKMILISILFSLISVILGFIVLIKTTKKKVKVTFDSLMLAVPDFINCAESKFDNGAEKLEFVLCCCVRFLSDQFNLAESEVIKNYGDVIVQFIESILTTPTKKVR